MMREVADYVAEGKVRSCAKCTQRDGYIAKQQGWPTPPAASAPVANPTSNWPTLSPYCLLILILALPTASYPYPCLANSFIIHALHRIMRSGRPRVNSGLQVTYGAKGVTVTPYACRIRLLQVQYTYFTSQHIRPRWFGGGLQGRVFEECMALARGYYTWMVFTDLVGAWWWAVCCILRQNWYAGSGLTVGIRVCWMHCAMPLYGAHTPQQ